MVLAWSWLLPAATAQTASGTPVVAVIDMQRIERGSKAIQSILGQLEEERESFLSELSEKEKDLRQADEKLARQRAILSSDAFEQKRRELRAQVGELQQKSQQRRQQLLRVRAQAMQTVQEKLVAIVADIAKKRGIDMVIRKAAVIIVRPEMEITETALERLNEQLTSVDLPDLQN